MSRNTLNSKQKLPEKSGVNIQLSVRYDVWLKVYFPPNKFQQQSRNNDEQR